jgi:hypothetical protein
MITIAQAAPTTPPKTTESVGQPPSFDDYIPSAGPVYAGFSFVLAVVLIVIAMAKPIMGLRKDIKQSGAEDAKSTAETSLYEQLQGQIEANTISISRLVGEKETWFIKAAELDGEVKRLKLFEEMVVDMKVTLHQQQRTIDMKDKQILDFMNVILELKEQVHKLEISLSNTERDTCLKCIYLQSGGATPQEASTMINKSRQAT